MWSFDGGIEVPASSSPHSVRLPYSIENAVDPEEALVAATSSCHMLTFLWLAAGRGFVVESYEDNAEGELTTGANRKQWISRITLRPRIKWSGEKLPSGVELAEMHREAHDQCYIANSIRSEVVVEADLAQHA
jgi:organic hydroperoxide reductase OsmC/OhrA